jgi:hypothetical protein
MKEQKKCPSATMEVGASLLGIVNSQGEVDFLANEILINDAFIESAKQGRTPEQRFRFSNKCIESGCKQWTGTRCAVVDNVLNDIEGKYWKENLPNCSIRSNCRWFDQSGADACKVCTYVTTLRD